jgi:hypothetical protein
MARFHQFDAVAERIVNISALVAFERLVLNDSVSSPLQLCDKCPKIIDHEGGVRLTCRDKFFVYTEMNFQSAALEPASTSGR